MDLQENLKECPGRTTHLQDKIKYLGNNPNIILENYFIFYNSIYRVAHKDFRDDCTDFILSISLYLGFSAPVNCFFVDMSINRPLKDNIKGRMLNL